MKKNIASQKANLQSANSTNNEQIAKNKAEVEMNFAMLGNTDDVLNHLQEGSMSLTIYG